jgi:hypothetical protein
MAFKIKDSLRVGTVDIVDQNGNLLVTAPKATNVAGGSAGQVHYQSAADTTAFVTNGTTGQYLKSNGNSAPSWADIPATVTISDDNATATDLYLALVSATSGNLTQVTVDGTTTPLKYVPSTGTLSSPVFSGSGASLTSIPNAGLVNSSITINGSAIALGGSVSGLALTANTLAQFAATTSAQLAGVISDETGSGALVFATSPTLATPVLGVATATSVNKVAITAPATSATLTLANGSTLATAGAFSITLTSTAATSVTLPTSGTLATTGNLSQFAATTSAQLAGVISDETGSGALVFGTSPTFTTSVVAGSATLAVFNTTATTVNAFGAATTLTLGAGTGTTTVNNNLTVAGNLTISGTTTTVNSTTVTIDDPIFTLGGDTAPASDDAKDRGIEFRWHNGTVAKVGFFGFDRSTGKMTFIPDATNTSEVFSGAIGEIDATIAWSNVTGDTTVGSNLVTLTNPSAISFLRVNADNTVSALDAATFRTAIGAGTSSTTGTVTSVSMTVPTGLSISGSPITGSGTLALTMTAGYAIPTTTSQTNWDTAYTDRLKWDGGATGLVAATGRTSLGATTVGGNLFTLTNPTAVTFLRVNADNTVSTLDAATFRTAIGALGAEADTLATVTGRGATTATALTFTNATDSTSSTTGALIIDGGVAIKKNLTVVGNIAETTAAGTKIADSNAVQATVAAITATAVDSWAVATYRSCKYVVQITQGTNYQVSEILVIHNGTTTTMTEFAVLETNGALATFTSDVNTGNARLLVTMGSATSATINVTKTMMVI